MSGVEPALLSPSTALKVYLENKNTNPTSPNQLSANLKVANTGNQPINYDQLTVRYWFSAEGHASLVYTVDYAELGASNIKSKFVKENRTGADTYLEVSFASALGQLQALSSTGVIQQRVNKSDWSNFNETNDYSYQVAGPSAENPKITAYLNGSLVFGQEPAMGSLCLAMGSLCLGTEELLPGLQIIVFNNLIKDDFLKVAVSGTEGKPLQLLVTDIQGRIVAEQYIDRANSVEQCQLSITHQHPGILLLQVSTPHEKQTVRLLKQTIMT